MYFYVPKGLGKLALFQESAYPIEVRDSTGQVHQGKGRKLIVIDVPPGQDGKVWSISKYKAWTGLRLLNVPQAFSFSPDAILVPKELAE